MSAPVGAVFYFELKYGDTKGSVAAGSKLVKDFNRTYSSEYIDGEPLGVGNGSLSAFNGTLAWAPIRAGSVKVVAGTITATDDGAGKLTGTGIASGTIDYLTGNVAVTLSAAPATGVAVAANYNYNSEGSSKIPTVNVDIALVAVTAKSRKIKALWSSEAADDLKALHGIKKAA